MRASRLIVVSLLAVGCIERAQQGQPPPSRRPEVDRSAARSFVIPAIPPNARPVGAKFGNAGQQIELAAMMFDPPTAQPGANIRVTYFFRVLAEPDENWEVFVHIEDPKGQRINNGDHWPTGGGQGSRYPTTAWRPGEIIRDDWGFQVPNFPPPCTSPNTPAGCSDIDHLDFWTGLYNPARTDGNDRLQVVGAGQTRDDGHNRVLAGSLSIRG